MNLYIDLLLHNMVYIYIYIDMVYEMSNIQSKLSVCVTQANTPSEGG